MQLDDQLLVGHIPAQDRLVRRLMDAGRFADADAAFDELTAAGTDRVDAQWNRPAVLVHRAVLAWRLGRFTLALELVTDGWTDMDVQHPSGPAAAHTISMLGSLMDSIGRHGPAMDLFTLSVQIARESHDREAMAFCMVAEGLSRVFRADSDETPLEHFEAARLLCSEAEELTAIKPVRRAALAGHARALAGLDKQQSAEAAAREALTEATTARDRYTMALANWVLAVLRRAQDRRTEARSYAFAALEGAQAVHDTILMMRFSRHLATICAELNDPFGENAALRVAVHASSTAVKLLSEALGQALEQRRVALQAQRMATEAREASLRDSLTGLINRRGLETLAPPVLEQCAIDGSTPWLVLLDVDWFKDVNDFAGHTAGDVVLQEVAGLLLRECRAGDLVCRWAGDEFVVLLVEEPGHDTGPAGPAVAERIRSVVDTHDWRLVLARLTKPPTVSVGVTSGRGNLHELFANADIALYRAKRAGRNRVAANPGTSALT